MRTAGIPPLPPATRRRTANKNPFTIENVPPVTAAHKTGFTFYEKTAWRTMYANSEDFQVLAITTTVSSFVAE